jgi:hypothetical protein
LVCSERARGELPRSAGRQEGDPANEHEQPGEQQALHAHRAGPGQPVTAQRRSQQAPGEQIVRASGHGRRQEQAVHHAEERQLEEQRQAAGQQAAAFGPVQGRQFPLQPFGLAGVALAEFGDLGLQGGHRRLAAVGVVAER